MDDTVVRAAKCKTCTGRVLQRLIGSAEPCRDDCFKRCWLIILVVKITWVGRVLIVIVGVCRLHARMFVFSSKVLLLMRSKVNYRRVEIGGTFQ